MRRRGFLGALAGAAVWPVLARAQSPVPVVGFLHGASAQENAFFVAEFHKGLSESGYVEGRNVAIEYRWANGKYDRLPEIVTDLIHRKVAVIAAVGGVAPALAAKAATANIPIIFSNGADPIKLGLVDRLNRPGGNVTGINFFASVMEAKRFGLLREFVPAATSIAVLLNPSYPNAENQKNEVKEAVRAHQVQLQFLHASNERDIDLAFAALQAGGLQVCADPFLHSRRNQIVALAAQHSIPAMYEQRGYAVAGGLASYGTNLADAYRQVGIYTARVLNGENPGDLPVMQSIKFEFLINLKTAKSLKLEVQPTLLARADEVIE